LGERLGHRPRRRLSDHANRQGTIGNACHLPLRYLTT
jgi:hypothetical protein